MTAALDPDVLRERLQEALAQHDVPAASLAVRTGTQRVCVAAGVTSTASPVEVDEHTLFLIGSVTKVWTATLVMQLVDEGRLDLDSPVNAYLDPPLRLVDPAVADQVTVRHLLTHTGGFLGDVQEPPGRGDDAVALAVASLADVPIVHAPGRLHSYSNSGYDVLGRLVECLLGQTWDDAVRSRLVERLGLRRTESLPERALLHRTAVGHEVDAETGEVTPVSDAWCDVRGSGPCGGTLATTAEELVTFADLHLSGQASDGTTLLSEESRAQMQSTQVVLGPGMYPAWGLGWAVVQEEGPRAVGHGGATNGQYCELVVVPDAEIVVALLTNGDRSGALRRQVTGPLLEELAGVRLPAPPPPAPNAPLTDLDAVAGSYATREVRLDVSVRDDQLVVRVIPLGAEVAASEQVAAHAGDDVFLVDLMGRATTLRVVRDDAGRATHLVVALRAVPRVA